MNQILLEEYFEEFYFIENLINEKIIEQIFDEDYFYQFDFQLNDIMIELYQLFEHLNTMNDDQINISTFR
jgi:hypothetical protein